MNHVRQKTDKNECPLKYYTSLILEKEPLITELVKANLKKCIARSISMNHLQAIQYHKNQSIASIGVRDSKFE